MTKEAYVLVTLRDGYIGPEEERPNVETFWFEGTRYDVALDKMVKVPLELAIELKRSGRIKDYQPA